MLSCYLSSVSTKEIGRSRIGGQKDNDQEKVPTWMFRLRNVVWEATYDSFGLVSAGPSSVSRPDGRE